MGKVVYGNLIFWILYRAFYPSTHIDTTQTFIQIAPYDLLHYLFYIPVMAFFYLLIYKMASPKGRTAFVWKLFNHNVFMCLGGLATIAILILTIYSEVSVPIAAHGSIAAWGLLLSIVLAFAYKFKYLSSPVSILMGIMAAFFVIGFFEAPYHVIRYYIHPYQANTFDNMLAIVFRQMFYLTPFVISCLIWKVRITKVSLYLFGAYVMMWLIWIFPGHFWTIYTTHNGYQELNLPVNWPIYKMALSSKSVMGLALLYLDYKRIGV